MRYLNWLVEAVGEERWPSEPDSTIGGVVTRPGGHIHISFNDPSPGPSAAQMVAFRDYLSMGAVISPETIIKVTTT